MLLRIKMGETLAMTKIKSRQVAILKLLAVPLRKYYSTC